ncbi:MAG: SpoIIE family protein phosphatase [Bacteroidales bacterium]
MEEYFGVIRFAGLEPIVVVLVALMFLMSVYVLFIRKRSRIVFTQGRDRNLEKESTTELVEQRNKLRRKAKNMEDSLLYAQRIQKAMFMSPDTLRTLFPDSFVFQRPKDIVSGDFYWFKRINGKVVFAVADCTGHGVPGAFMSLIGLEFFRQIVVERKILQPSLILDEMNVYFDKVFGSLEEISLKDGMDLVFCAYDYVNQELEIAGAFNPVYVVRSNEVIEVKGDRITVGPDYGARRGSFTNHHLKIQKEDVIYLFSDGFPDQFGGPEGKKFKYRRFRLLLMSIHKLPMEEQKRRLEENMREWMGDRHEQIDDQMVIGIRPASFASSG